MFALAIKMFSRIYTCIFRVPRRPRVQTIPFGVANVNKCITTCIITIYNQRHDDESTLLHKKQCRTLLTAEYLPTKSRV